MGVEVRVLGPLEVLRDGQVISLSSPKPRLLLAILVSHANQVLSVDRLVDVLWLGQPPPTAVAVVQSYVSQLRKALEAPGRREGEFRVLLREDGGYRMVVAPEQVDATRFERLSDAGRLALAHGHPAEGLQSLPAGLALWRGEAFGELSLQSAIQPAAQRLAELRQLAI